MTNAERLAITPPPGQFIFCTDTDHTFIGDGATAGGLTLGGAGSEINVKAYGAKGDGVTDDYAAFAAAIADSDTKTLFVPAGTYLLSANLALKSNFTLYGEGPNTILKATVDAQRVLTGTSLTNLIIRDISINGGGQTSDIYTGVKAAIGIYLNACSFFVVQNVNITKCGVARSSTPTSDNGFGGFGILQESRGGAAGSGLFFNVNVSHIAGGGNAAGDGINIAGYNASTSVLNTDITIMDCNVSTVGRHAYTLTGGSGASIPSDVRIIGCYAEKTALCGVDFEDGDNSGVIDCQFSACGNDQTYFNPASSYGATYRLLAGIAVGNNDKNITVEKSHIMGCYYGITYGATDGFSVDNCTVETSTVSDLFMGLSASPKNFKLTNNTFKTSTTIMLLYSVASYGNEILNCDFAGLIQLQGCLGAVFTGNTFRKGFQITGSEVQRLTLRDNIFLDFAGVGLSFSGINKNSSDCLIVGNKFIGTGNMTYGIEIQYDCALRWRIEGNLFQGQTTAGIRHTNTNGGATFASSISNNNFRSCVTGILISQQGVQSCLIANNYFESITAWCIDVGTINAAGNFRYNQFIGNIAGASVANGLRVKVGTGSWDYSSLSYNNWVRCTTSQVDIDIGNANGSDGVDQIDRFIEAPTAKTYVLRYSSKYTCNIVGISIGTASGTCTAAVQINGVSVTGLSALSVSSTINNANASGSYRVAAGDTITLVISGISSPIDLSCSLKLSRTS